MNSLSAASLKAGSDGKHRHGIPGLSRRRLMGLGFSLAALVLLLVGAVSYYSAQRAYERALSVAHTQSVLHVIQRTVNLLTDAETAQRGYVLTGRSDYLEPFERAKLEYPRAIAELQALIADNPAQQANLAKLRNYADQKLALLGQSADLRGDAEKLREAIASGIGKRLMDQARAQAQAMNQIEQALLDARARESEQSANVTRSIILAGFFLSIMLVVGSYLLLHRESEERDRAEAQVRTLNSSLEMRARELEISNRELEGFSYSVSHDLRVPLRAVSGYSQILEEDCGAMLDDEGRRLLGLVRQNARTMNTLIDDLLTFSRLGNAALRTGEVDMNALAASALQQCLAARAPREQQAKLPDVRIEPLPPARGDPALLRQVWINLLGNALKYSSRRDNIHIEADGRVIDGEAVYHVRDNGVGFDMRYADKLFGVFQRLHGPEEYAGTGVGLAIVQRIVLRHGGRVWADAKPDQGATFSFTLPKATPADAETAV